MILVVVVLVVFVVQSQSEDFSYLLFHLTKVLFCPSRRETIRVHSTWV